MKRIVSYFGGIFSLDLRSLGLARFFLGVIMLYDFIGRIPYINDFYTDEGLLTRKNFMNFMEHGWNWSIFMFTGNYWPILLLYLVMLVFIVLMTIGYRYRLTSFVVWVFMISISNRNWMLNNSGEDLYRVMLFVFMFLPMGSKYSVDNALKLNKNDFNNSYFSIWTFIYIVQISAVYFVSYYFKTGSDWRVSYRATYMALSIGVFTRDWVSYVLEFKNLLKYLTMFVIKAEGFAHYLLLFGFTYKLKAYTRYILISIWVGFHASLIFAMKIGAFPWICIAVWFGLLPAHFWDSIFKVRKYYPKTTIYYDGYCGFCKKGVYILREFFLLNNVEIRFTQSNYNINQIMLKNNSWVVSDESQNTYQHINAFNYLIKNNSRLSFLKFFLCSSFVSKIGDKAYRFIANNRKLFSSLTKPFKFSHLKLPSPSSLALVILGMLYIGTVVTWNLHKINYKKPYPLRNFFIKSAQWSNLFQYWGMFSPNVRSDEGYFVVDGKLTNGQHVDLFHNLPFVDASPPKCLSCEFKTKEWRKFFMNLTSKPKYQDYYSQYLCKRWNRKRERLINSDLREIKIYYILRHNLGPEKGKSDWKKKKLWHHHCFEKDWKAHIEKGKS